MGTAEVERYLLDREQGASRRQALDQLRRRGMHEGYGKQLDRRLRVAVNRTKALWPRAADQDLGGLEWIRAVCAPLCESTPLLSLNRFCLANHVNAVCFCRSSILLFRMAPNSARKWSLCPDGPRLRRFCHSVRQRAALRLRTSFRLSTCIASSPIATA